jgi:hypothetical protein
MMDPTYKTVLLLWAKDLAETVIFGVVGWRVARRLVKGYFAALKCPHCGKKFGDAAKGAQGAALRGEVNDGEAQAVGKTNPDLGR